MTFHPTNVFCHLHDGAAYNQGDCMDATQLRRALGIDNTDECWTKVLLMPDFAATEVAVKLEDREFFAEAVANSLREPGDFTRLRRRVQLPDDVDAGSVRCWMQDGLLLLQADRVQQQQQQQQSHKSHTPTCETAGRSELLDVGACLVKDKAAGRTRWTLDLPLYEFDEDEVSVSKEAGKIVIVAEHSAKSAAGSGRLALRRELTPPTGVQLEMLATSFNDGVLRLSAPAPGLKPKRHGRIATLTRDLRHAGPSFQEKGPCAIC